jgi:hypothetical protein
MMRGFQQEATVILQNAINLTYFFRGAIQYHDVFRLTPIERMKMDDFLEERFEQEKKSPNPVY